MTSRLRGSAKEEPKTTSLLSSKNRTYLSSGREPREKSGFEGSRNKVSRKDSRGKYDNFPQRSPDTDYERNGFGYGDEDPDLLYRRSREHFGSWDIRDIVQERSKSDARSRFDSSRSNVDEGRKIANGGKYGGSGSPDLARRKNNALEKSPTRDKARRKSPCREIGGTIECRARYEDAAHPPRNRALLREIENFGANRRGENESPERWTSEGRRYAGNGVSPERDNEKIRQLIDRFKSSERNDEPRRAPSWRKSERYGSPSPENEEYRATTRSPKDKSSGAGAGFPSLERKVTRRSSRERDERIKENRESEGLGGTENNERNYNGEYGKFDPESRTGKFTERGEHRINGESRGSSEEGASRKRSDTYSVERGPRKSRDLEEDSRGSSSKRRSHVYSDSPVNFDVQIQRYERALTGPRRDPELARKNSTKERDPDLVRRRSSLKTREEPDENLERNGRHGRPLTPPEDDPYLRDDRKFEESGTSFDAKSWYESNKRFAVKYLEENGRVNGAARDDRLENELENRRSGPSREIYFGDDRGVPRNKREENYGPRHVSSPRTEGTENPREPNRKSLNGNGEPITIKIRNVTEERSEKERRTKRGTFPDAPEDSTNARNRRKSEQEGLGRKEGRWNGNREWSGGTATPARKIWSYREGGAQITDVDEGQPCLKCGETCPGFLQHSWRKNCNSCKCPREAHDVCHDEWVSVRSRLGLKGDGVGGSVSCEPRDLGLAWAPPGLPSHKVEEYFSMLPEVSVPRLGTPGERYRDRQLAMQLPKQDLAKAYCRHLAPEHYTSADDFMAARNEIALDIGTVQEILEKGEECAGCNEALKYGSLAVSAGKLGELYHPACFQCVQCRELLVDLAYCVYNDAVYCERHYAERLKGRCPACDELIFSGEFTRAMNKDWHSGHFCCWQCDESLTGQRYVLRDEHPYCIKCYESVFANGCEECSKIIGIDSKDLSYKDKHWHEACFLCNKCRVSLVDKQFGSKVDKIYCGNCYDAQFASRCDGCGEIFRAGTKKMEYKTRQWHEKCFCCVVCKNPIGTKSFIPREQEIYCAGCYEDKFATRCVKCNKIITSGGVTYKNEPWHRECFTCSNCSTSLAGQRFTSRDEKPYCADCFGELFAKRCTACTKPITGIGGTRFISFEDRHWHNDCFICAGCKTSLVGRGFITDADDVICPECAKQKLM